LLRIENAIGNWKLGMQRMRLAKFSAEKKKKLKTGGFDPPKKKDPGSRNAWMM
jgi:hypothetical protein